MGAGIAYSCARAGMQVVLKDVALENAEKGKAYSAKLNAKAVERGKLTRGEVRRAARPDPPDRRPGRPRRLRPGDRGGLRGPLAQAPGVRRGRAVRRRDALLCSNTSTLPITELATGVDRPAGLHRPALLLARSTRCRWSRSSAARRPPTSRSPRRTTSCSRSGRRRSSSTTAAASTPRGSSASWSTRGSRCSPRACTRCRLERAATQAGYPVGTLQLSDELNMELMAKIGKATQDAAERDGTPYEEHPAGRRDPADDRARPHLAAQGRRLLRLRRERAPAGAVVRAGRGVPGRRGADPAARRPGPDALRRGARDRQVLRRGRHRVGGRGQHRLDHGHRLPARDRRRGPVHDRLPGPRRPDRRDRAGRLRPPRRRAGRRATASGSGPRRTCASWSSGGSPSPPDPRGRRCARRIRAKAEPGTRRAGSGGGSSP